MELKDLDCQSVESTLASALVSIVYQHPYYYDGNNAIASPRCPIGVFRTLTLPYVPYALHTKYSPTLLMRIFLGLRKITAK